MGPPPAIGYVPAPGKFATDGNELRISAKFLEDEKRTMPDSHFRQEYLCEFTDNDRAVFSSADLDGIVDYDIKPLFPGKGL